MKVSDLKTLLDSFSNEQEITVTIFVSDDDPDPILTYDIGFGLNEFAELTLKVNGFYSFKG